MAIPPRYLLRQEFPSLHYTELATCTTQTECAPPPLPLSNISLATLAAFIASCAPQHTRNTHADCSMPRGNGRVTVTLFPLCLKTWIWPKPLTKRSHARNILSPNALTSGGSISSWHSVTHQGECEHMYNGISLKNTNAACISVPPTLPIHLALTN